MQIGSFFEIFGLNRNNFKENLAVFQECPKNANSAAVLVYQSATPKWRMHTKFSNFLNILFSITRLLKVVGLQSFAKSFHLAFSANLITGVAPSQSQ